MKEDGHARRILRSKQHKKMKSKQRQSKDNHRKEQQQRTEDQAKWQSGKLNPQETAATKERKHKNPNQMRK